MRVIAHRCFRRGIDRAVENNLAAFVDCLDAGYGIETDVRRLASGGFYISHDPVAADAAASMEPYLAAVAARPDALIALNIKELGYEDALAALLTARGLLDNFFLFDMELIEPEPGRTARVYRALSAGIQLAARVSDRGETIDRALSIDCADVIWLDEFDRLWVRSADIARLKDAGRRIYAISPEIHGFSHDQMRRRWDEFAEWGVDGICTDYADELAAHFSPGLKR